MQTFKFNSVNNYKMLYKDNIRLYRHINKILDKLATHEIKSYNLEVFGFNVENKKISYNIRHTIGLPHPLDIDANSFENVLSILKEHGAKELNINLFFEKPENLNLEHIEIEE